MLLPSNWVQSSAEINSSTSQGVAWGPGCASCCWLANIHRGRRSAHVSAELLAVPNCFARLQRRDFFLHGKVFLVYNIHYNSIKAVQLYWVRIWICKCMCIFTFCGCCMRFYGTSPMLSKQLPQLPHFAFCIQGSFHNQKGKLSAGWRSDNLTEQRVCWQLEQHSSLFSPLNNAHRFFHPTSNAYWYT